MRMTKKTPNKRKLSRAERYKRVVALLRKWSEEKSDYDEKTWPAIERALNGRKGLPSKQATPYPTQ